mmetsp:Transcript_9408/g.32507  ORF Transcript_9408/g.32507 Transcript_9408/m.32507 type:complete len:328 (+) Transcript_9408:799-1782(+)
MLSEACRSKPKVETKGKPCFAARVLHLCIAITSLSSLSPNWSSITILSLLAWATMFCPLPHVSGSRLPMRFQSLIIRLHLAGEYTLREASVPSERAFLKIFDGLSSPMKSTTTMRFVSLGRPILPAFASSSVCTFFAVSMKVKRSLAKVPLGCSLESTDRIASATYESLMDSISCAKLETKATFAVTSSRVLILRNHSASKAQAYSTFSSFVPSASCGVGKLPPTFDFTDLRPSSVGRSALAKSSSPSSPSTLPFCHRCVGLSPTRTHLPVTPRLYPNIVLVAAIAPQRCSRANPPPALASRLLPLTTSPPASPSPLAGNASQSVAR